MNPTPLSTLAPDKNVRPASDPLLPETTLTGRPTFASQFLASVRTKSRTLAHRLGTGSAWCFLALGVFASAVAHAQTRPELFRPDTPGAVRDVSQARRIEQIRRQPTTDSLTIVRIDASALDGAGVRIQVGRLRSIDVDRTSTEVRSDTDFTWSGGLVGVQGNAILVAHDGNVTGSVRDGLDLYKIEPLGRGLHAIVKIDPSRFPPEHPPSFHETERHSPVAIDPASMTDPGDDAIRTMAPQVIDVLVAYTPAARSAVGDIRATIQLAMAETNQSYANSGVNIQLRLVDNFEVSYSESGKSYETILNDFAHMPTVLDRRDGSGADMSAMIINQADYCGMANAIMANASTAFAVVHYSCATGYYSFGHELGHLQGARHDPANDSTPTPFAYGHGYQQTAADPRWRTIMAYNCAGGCARLPYWANPNVLYNGLPMGTASVSHDARVLNETAAMVAAFRSTTSPDYVYCANEWQACGFSGTRMVAYGAYDKFFYRRLTDGTACNNSVFGDPLPGVGKACYVGNDVYDFCTNEGGYCGFTGTRSVAYGANGKFNYGTITNGTSCDNATFGDPIPGVWKACHVGPAAYTYCALEWQTCTMSGTSNVAYGADGRFTYRTLSGSFSCDNATFGDPAVGLGKACYVGPVNYTHCASEWLTCSFSGTRMVAYGANGTFIHKSLSGPVACTNATFGDPAPGVVKACYIQ